MNLFIIRHGESVWNKQQRVQGREDPGLSASGKRQARSAARRLRKEGIKVIYASDLRRAAQTARIIARETGARLILYPEIEEIILGAWQGKTIEEVKRLYPKSYMAWLKAPSTARIPGWEGLPRFTRRIDRAFKYILSKNPDSSVCVVTHWGVIAAYLSSKMRTDFDRFFKTVRIDNCGINKVSFKNGKAIIQCINSTRHLG